MQYILLLLIQTCIIHCLLFYVLVFGIAHVPQDKLRGIEDAAEALSETLKFLQMELDAETS